MRKTASDTPPRHPPATQPSPAEQAGLAAAALADCLVLYLRIAAGRASLDLPALADALRRYGLSVLPALTLVSAALGLILGRQGSTLLERFDLPGLVLLSVSYGVVVELVPILVGILVAGRAGVALAVRQASQGTSGETDGLLICGLDPIQFTLAPVLLAMVLLSFAFAVWSTLVTFAAAFLWLWSAAGVPPALFLDALRQSLGPGELVEAFLKPPVFALTIALFAMSYGFGGSHGRITRFKGAALLTSFCAYMLYLGLYGI